MGGLWIESFEHICVFVQPYLYEASPDLLIITNAGLLLRLLLLLLQGKSFYPYFIHVAAYKSGVSHKRAALFAVLRDKSSDRNLTGMNRCRVNVEVN